MVQRLEEVLADAEKMARRVDRVLEEDPFAASLLAREYLSRVKELEVNPLNQQGRTDAWISAFVRLRVAAGKLDKHADRADGEAYLAARAEERRLFSLLGTTPRTRLTHVRATARSKRAQSRASLVVAWLVTIGAAAVSAVALSVQRPTLAVACAIAGAGVAAFFFALYHSAAKAGAEASQRAVEIQRGVSTLALFELDDNGRGILQRVQREHPLLMKTSLGEGSSMPPPPTSGVHPRSK
jgi:hypothetical protein